MICDQLSSERATLVKNNRLYRKSICQVAVLCARQDIALRGHDETEEFTNKGNFLEILDLVSSHNPSIQDRLLNGPQNAKYTSKSVQNELLEAVASVIIEHITNQIRKATCFSIIADETRDISRIERLTLCIRYVCPDDHVVQEQFLGFVDCHELDAEALATQIIHKIERLGLNMNECIAQCYDGAAVISHLSGVQARIRERVGNKCFYIHCYAHRLNLVVVNTASCVEEVKDFFGIMEAVYRFINVSSRRHDKFVEAQKNADLAVMEIPRLSDTRWVSQYAAVRLFKERFGSLICTFETIAKGSNDGCE